MKLPDKFWFYHKSDSSKILFAARGGHNYAISGVDLVPPNTRTTDDVEYLFQYGHWILTVPDEFNIRGAVSGKEFSVSKFDNEDFILEGKDGRCSYFFRREDVLTNLYDIPPRWEILENTTEKLAQESPLKRLISINVNDARSAAEFDVVNNPHTIRHSHSVEEIENEIVSYIRSMYERLMSGEVEWERHSVGRRSYTVSFQPEDEQYGIISVLVNPSIGKFMFFANVEEFLSQN